MNFCAILVTSLHILSADSPSSLPSDWQTIRGERADSAWSLEKWSFEAIYHSGINFGDLWSEENKMADRIGFTVTQAGSTQKASIMLQTMGIGIGGWRSVRKNLDAGVSYEHDWVFAQAGDAGFGLLLSTNALVGRARWFPLRRLIWELGPQIGFGPIWGTLSRYPLEQDARHPSDQEQTAYWLSVGNDDRKLSGFRGEVGGALEVRILPRFGIGGSILLVRDAWTIDGTDPLSVTNANYTKSPVDYNLGVATHAALRF